MANRVIIGLALLLAIVMTFAPELDGNTGGVLALVLVVLGLAYAAVAVDAEDAGSYLVLAIAVGAASQAAVLSSIPAIGEYLDGIVGHISTVLYAGAVTVVAQWSINRLKG